MKLFLTDKMLLFEDIIEDFAAESFFQVSERDLLGMLTL